MRTLCQVKCGGEATVLSLSLRGAMRRRLQDLGFVPGARVRPLYRSCSGDPTAYLVSGAVIALRSDDAVCIVVSDT